MLHIHNSWQYYWKLYVTPPKQLWPTSALWPTDCVHPIFPPKNNCCTPITNYFINSRKYRAKLTLGQASKKETNKEKNNSDRLGELTLWAFLLMYHHVRWKDDTEKDSCCCCTCNYSENRGTSGNAHVFCRYESEIDKENSIQFG